MDSTRRNFIQAAASIAGGAATLLTPMSAEAAQTATQQRTPAAPVSMSKTRKLRELLKRSEMVVAPSTYTAATSAIAEAMGYECLFSGGGAMTGMYFALRDWGLIQPVEFAQIAGMIGEGTNIPLIADADQGGENAMNNYRTVRIYERAGIAGMTVEDTTNPKRYGTQNLDNLIPTEAMVARIAATAEGRMDPDFVIVARTETFYNALQKKVDRATVLDEVIRKGVAFAKAGADVFFPIEMLPEHVDKIASEVPIPLADVRHPLSTTSKLRLNLMSGIGNSSMLVAYEASLIDLKAKGRQVNAPGPKTNTDSFAHVAAYEKFSKLWVDALKNQR